MKVKHIFIYPIKSLAGISLSASETVVRGLTYDRRYMLVDEEGLFISQRTFPPLALFKTGIANGELLVTDTRTGSEIILPLQKEEGQKSMVKIWSDECEGVLVNEEADRFFSIALGKKCRLVYMPEQTHRPVNPKYAENGEVSSFADDYPLLIIGSASLEDLNRRLQDKNEAPLWWDRFRPNIVIETTVPYEEDEWKEFRIGNNLFRGASLCGRCVMTTIDQQTGVAGKEPLKTLAGYRTFENKVMFGKNVIAVDYSDLIRLGDVVELEAK